MIEIWTSSRITPDYNSIKYFLQKMVNRLIVGHERYGPPHNKQKYLKRLKLELKAYDKDGNIEHLINVANYCYLESVAPQSSKAHLDITVESATRGKL